MLRRGQIVGSVAVVASLCLAATGCAPRSASHAKGGGSAPTATSSTTTTEAPAPAPANLPTDQPPVAPVAWQPCEGGFDCASVTVPVEYRDPAGPTLQLSLTRHAASDPSQRVGVLFFNPGGPGEAAGATLRVTTSLFPPELLDRFDIVALDQRGTGGSSKLDCGPSEVQAVATPLSGSSGGLAALYEQTMPACRQAAAALGRVDTITAARDLDRARQAVGGGPLNFLGLSYGTLLGDVYAQMFPHDVRAMVLDGAVDPRESLEQQVADQAAVDETALHAMLQSCATQAGGCPLGADPAAGYEQLREKLASSPLPPPGGGAGLPVSDGDLGAAALSALTLTQLYSTFFHALDAAQHGDGSVLRGLATTLDLDADGTSVLGPYWAIGCSDTVDHPGPAALASIEHRLSGDAPDFALALVGYELAGCAGWPASAHPLPSGPAAGTPPIVVIGGATDPQTPLAWARNMVRELGGAVGRLVIRHTPGHTALLNGGGGACVTNLETAYLVDAKVPAAVTDCPA